MGEKKEITRTTTLGEILSKRPEAAEVMMSYGLHCISCIAAAGETIEQGAIAHRIEGKLDDLLKELNNLGNDC